MNEDVDLRVYVDVLIRHWRLIAAAIVLGVAAGVAISLLSPAKYQATAVVLVTNPLAEFQVSPAADSASPGQPPLAGRAAVELATTDALLQQVLVQVGHELPPDERNLFSLRRMIRARTGADASVINFVVTVPGADQAALIANTWADLYTEQVNALYGKSPDQSSFYAEQLARAESDMNAADQALVDFQKENELAVLQAQLSAKQKALSEYLARSETLLPLQQDAQDLQDQLARRPAGSASTLGDQIAQLILRMSVLSVPAGGLSVQLQVPRDGSLGDTSAGEQAVHLADLVKTIESRRADAATQAGALLPEIKALQGRIQAATGEETQLTRAQELAQDVYAAVALKARESSITAQAGSGSVRLVSSAAVPDRPVSRKLATHVGLGVVLGLLVSAGLAFTFEYFQERAVAPANRQREPALWATEATPGD